LNYSSSSNSPKKRSRNYIDETQNLILEEGKKKDNMIPAFTDVTAATTLNPGLFMETKQKLDAFTNNI